MEHACLRTLPQQVADFLRDLSGARVSVRDVMAGLEDELRSNAIQPGTPVESPVTERSKIQCNDLADGYRELLAVIGGSIRRVTPNLDMVALGVFERRVLPIVVEAHPEMPVFWFTEPGQTRKLILEVLDEDPSLLPQIAAALTALAAQLVDDLTGNAPIDLSGEEVVQLAASADQLASSFVLLGNERFSMFFYSLGTANRAGAVQPFLRWLAHAWDVGYEPEMGPLQLAESLAVLEAGLEAFRDWAATREAAKGELNELYSRALAHGVRRLLARYQNDVELRSRFEFSL